MRDGDKIVKDESEEEIKAQVLDGLVKILQAKVSGLQSRVAHLEMAILTLLQSANKALREMTEAIKPGRSGDEP